MGKIFIYCLFNENSIPFYIGKTKNSLKLRKNQHKRKLKTNLEIFELDSVKKEEWKFWEEFYIELFNSWGFKLINQNKGGGGLSFHTEETKKKMRGKKHLGTSLKLKNKKRPDVSKRLKGTKFSKETKQKISKAKKDHICYKNIERNSKISKSNQKNYKLNSLRNQKISEKLKGRKADWMKFRNKPILQFDLQGNFIKEWKSQTEASISLNKSSSAINECCNNKRKSAYKYIWKFKL